MIMVDVDRSAKHKIVGALLFLAMLACVCGGTIWGIAAAAAEKVRALETRAESAAALEARLVAANEEMQERLAAIGVSRSELPVVTDAELIVTAVLNACERLGAPSGQECAVEETTISNRVSRYRASFAVRQRLPEAFESIAETVASPLRLDEVVLRPVGEGAVEIAGYIVAVGRSRSEAQP